jgi:DNA-binding transcriptional LysR family regulator
MHRRYDTSHVPIELVRALVTIDQTRSYAEASRRLGISSPALTAQVKRLETILGARVVRTTSTGAELLPFGASLLAHARAMLDANDRLIAVSRGTQKRTDVRLGLSSLYAGDYYDACNDLGRLSGVAIRVGHSDDLDRLFLDGQLDIVCSLQPTTMADSLAIWDEQPVWVRSPDFTPVQGAPIPIVALQGARPDAVVVEALQRNGLLFDIVVASADLNTRTEAVAKGLGLSAIPRRYIKPPLVEFNASYMPKIQQIVAAIRARTTEIPQLAEIMERLATNKPTLHRDGVKTPGT